MSSSSVLRLVMLALLVVVAGGVALNAILYGVARRVRRREHAACPFDDDEPLPWPARQLVRLRSFVAECAAMIFVALAIPLGWRRGAIAGAPGRPVLLLGGRLAPRVSFRRLARRLQHDGWLPVVVGQSLWTDDERSAASLASTIDRVRRATGAGDVDVLAHGSGGLVARLHIRTAGQASGVARLVTIGTPHQGTEASPTARLRPDSPLLARLGEDDPVPTLVETVAIYSRDDALVVPTTRAYYPGAFNIELGDVGHLSLLFSRRVHALVCENLAAESDRAATAATPAR